jgi:methylglutaconyl-CoA hydratase
VSEALVSRDGPAVTITINRPEVRNAFGASLIAQLTQLFAALALDDSRVIVLTGAGEAFSAGADANWMRASLNLDPARNVGDAAALRTMFETVDACRKPVVARVNGHALGGGAGLVACADVAVAADAATFAFSEVRLGVLPATIAPYVLRAIGPGATRSLWTTGRPFDAAEALRLGLVHRVVPEADLDAAVDEVVGWLSAGGPDAIAASKALVRDATASFTVEDLPERIAAARIGDEAKEGVTAFLEKRKPSWSGGS